MVNPIPRFRSLNWIQIPRFVWQTVFLPAVRECYISRDCRINVIIRSRRSAMANYCPLRHRKFIRTIHSLFITVASYYSHFAKQAKRGGRKTRINPLAGESRSMSRLIVAHIRTERELARAILFSRSMTLSRSRFYLLAASTLSLKLRCTRAPSPGNSCVFVRTYTTRDRAVFY